MDDQIHAAAVGHLPFFITAPGATDTLFNVMAVVVLTMIVLLGSFYFQLHALPERMAHRANHTQMQLVAVLALIALFTHQHIFWIVALLLALVRFPDFRTPTVSIAESLERIANRVEAGKNEPRAMGMPPALTPAGPADMPATVAAEAPLQEEARP